MDPFVSSFETLTRDDPGAPALITGGRTVTRAELLAAARRAERDLSASGVGAGSVVSFECAAGASFTAGWLALRALGAAVLLVDADVPEDERRRIHARVPADFIWRVAASGVQSMSGTIEACTAGPLRASDAYPPGTAAVKLTSGSSGQPAGVAVGAAELEADGRQLASTLGITGRDRFLCTIPFAHSYGLSLLPTSLFRLGTALVVPEGVDPLEAAREGAATILPSVPAWYRARARVCASGDDWPASLRLFVSAGAPLPPELARTWRASTGRPIHALYGSSECGSITFDRTGSSSELGRVGTPLDGVRVELVAPEGPGEERTVRVHSAAVALSYVPAADARAGRIRRDAEGATFDTEDVAAFEDGELRLLGRRSRWINVNGRKVDPLEVEAAIAAMPGVEEVAVLGKPLADASGEIVRAVVVRSDARLGYRDVAAWCRSRLPAHKVPRSIVLVEALPRTERGKLDRAALASY